MTGWINGVYSKYHCEAQRPTPQLLSIANIERCNRPATLRKFRDSNVPLCDECYSLLTDTTTSGPKES